MAVAALGAATVFAQYQPPAKKPATSETQPAQPETKSLAPEEKSSPAKAKRVPSEPKAAVPPAVPEPSALAPLAWLEGCWRGTVNRREYREH